MVLSHGFGRSTKDAEPTEKPLVMASKHEYGCVENEYIVCTLGFQPPLKTMGVNITTMAKP